MKKQRRSCALPTLAETERQVIEILLQLYRENGRKVIIINSIYSQFNNRDFAVKFMTGVFFLIYFRMRGRLF